MTKLVTAALVAAGLMIAAPYVHADAIPGVSDPNPFPDFSNAKSGIGPDGNERFLWDIFQGTVYAGSNFWILNSTGQIISAGNETIPASVGTGLVSTGLSNTAVHVHPSNNTQVVFAFPNSLKQVTAFATWTYGPTGQLIAAAGPFSFAGLQILSITFSSDQLVVKWGAAGLFVTSTANSVWVLDEFGTVVSAAGPYGPFGTTVRLGEVAVEPSTGNQLWHWLLHSSSGFQLNTWTINSSGTVIASSSYGPF